MIKRPWLSDMIQLAFFLFGGIASFGDAQGLLLIWCSVLIDQSWALFGYHMVQGLRTGSLIGNFCALAFKPTPWPWPPTHFFKVHQIPFVTYKTCWYFNSSLLRDRVAYSVGRNPTQRMDCIAG